jgi:hypothetical protein
VGEVGQRRQRAPPRHGGGQARQAGVASGDGGHGSNIQNLIDGIRPDAR